MKYNNRNFYKMKDNNFIYKSIKEEVKQVGYYDLPLQDTTKYKNFAKSVKQKDIAVIGTGGNTLGTIAIYNFLKITNTYNKTLHFFESTDPIDIQTRLSSLDLNDTLFLVISKSGVTIETISLFKYFHTLTHIDKSNCVIVSQAQSKLTMYAKKHQMQIFEIPQNISGRFSVFSAVGLLPLAIIGVDIDNLLDGAKQVRDSFLKKGAFYKPLMQKARFLAENKTKYNINIVFSYSASLKGFNKWYMQLWGESLGKININGTKQALTPIGLVGPVDQHSFLQLIVEGKRDKTVTFIKINNFENNTIIPANTLDGFDDLEYIDGLTFSQLIEKQADATIAFIQNIADIPCDVITIDKVDEYNIASLMFNYQLLTSIIGKFIQINTYDQPGVEAGKIILKNKLKFK